MKNKILVIFVCGVLTLGITGCVDEDNSSLVSDESFAIGHTLDDGRVIHFTFDVPYNNGYLTDALRNDEMTVTDFINRLDFVSLSNDGGSKLYKYNSYNKVFGKDNFYVLMCNSYDNIKDIFVAKNTNTLSNKCIIKINDLDGVSMAIKSGTLTKEGATIVITDISSRKNIYGEPYRIDKFIDGNWQELEIIFEGNYGWTSIGYLVGGDNKLELEINWKWLYGELIPGKYRIVKDTSISGEGTTHYITAEFEIE